MTSEAEALWRLVRDLRRELQGGSSLIQALENLECRYDSELEEVS